MRLKRRLFPKVRYTNFHKQYPKTLAYPIFKAWVRVKWYWGGNIVNMQVKHHQLSFDFRRNWMEDMIAPEMARRSSADPAT